MKIPRGLIVSLAGVVDLLCNIGGLVGKVDNTSFGPFLKDGSRGCGLCPQSWVMKSDWVHW
jgi:hypothetical protein